MDTLRALRQVAAETAPERPRVREVSPWAWLRTLVELPGLQAAAVAASLVLLLFGNVWFAMRSASLSAQLAESRARQDSSDQAQRRLSEQVGALEEREAELRAQLQSVRGQPAGDRTPSRLVTAAPPTPSPGARDDGRLAPTFVLAAGLLRSQESLPRVAIPAGAQIVRLALVLPSHDYMRYHAALLDADGEEAWTQSSLTAAASARRTLVTITLPADALPAGEYQVRLSGTTAGGHEAVATYSFRVARR